MRAGVVPLATGGGNREGSGQQADVVVVCGDPLVCPRFPGKPFVEEECGKGGCLWLVKVREGKNSRLEFTDQGSTLWCVFVECYIIPTESRV